MKTSVDTAANVIDAIHIGIKDIDSKTGIRSSDANDVTGGGLGQGRQLLTNDNHKLAILPVGGWKTKQLISGVYVVSAVPRPEQVRFALARSARVDVGGSDRADTGGAIGKIDVLEAAVPHLGGIQQGRSGGTQDWKIATRTNKSRYGFVIHLSYESQGALGTVLHIDKGQRARGTTGKWTNHAGNIQLERCISNSTILNPVAEYTSVQLNKIVALKLTIIVSAPHAAGQWRTPRPRRTGAHGRLYQLYPIFERSQV
jgi:hypothetical protein